AVRIYKTYGDKALDLIRENPYRLATDVWGIGFQTADQLAAHMGIEAGSPLRAWAAVRYVLQDLSSGGGHVGYPESEVVGKVADLKRPGAEAGMDPATVREAVETCRADGELVREPFTDMANPPPDAPWLYLKSLFLAEIGVARALRYLSEGAHPLPTI